MAALRIGVVGCGNISTTYLQNASLFKGVKITACADIVADLAAQRAKEFGLRAMTVADLMTADDVDLVLNLTVPNAHFDVSMQALEAGKHVFTEKPLAATAAKGRVLVDEARRRKLAIGSAPDTFLGAAGRLARQLMDDETVGKVVAGTAFMMGRGMEHWHPNPQFFYQPGGGPVLDMGPYYITMLVHLLGPARRVLAMSAIGQSERHITAPGPYTNTRFPVNTPTTVLGVIAFASGAIVTLGMSWDVYRHSNQPLELHGTLGSLRLPDPDTFGGVVAISEKGAPWREIATDQTLHGRINWPYSAPNRANYRMLGVADLARSLIDKRAPRASGELALHVLEIMEALLKSGETGQPVLIPESECRPAALGEAEAAQLAA